MTQMELNRFLFEATTAPELDLNFVEELLQEGADPLGSYNEDEDYTLDELFARGQYRDCAKRLPAIVDLFLRYGMDIETTEWDALHYLTWVRDEYGLQTLKLFLDAGLTASSAESFATDLIGHVLMFEADNLSTDSMLNDYPWVTSLEHVIKMILLLASYKHVFLGSRYIRELVCAQKEELHLFERFRCWDDYRCEVEFFESFIETKPGTMMRRIDGEAKAFELRTNKEIHRLRLIGFADLDAPEKQFD